MNINEGKHMYNTQTPVETLEQVQNELNTDNCPIDLDEVFDGLYVQVKKLAKN